MPISVEERIIICIAGFYRLYTRCTYFSSFMSYNLKNNLYRIIYFLGYFHYSCPSCTVFWIKNLIQELDKQTRSRTRCDRSVRNYSWQYLCFTYQLKNRKNEQKWCELHWLKYQNVSTPFFIREVCGTIKKNHNWVDVLWNICKLLHNHRKQVFQGSFLWNIIIWAKTTFNIVSDAVWNCEICLEENLHIID